MAETTTVLARPLTKGDAPGPHHAIDREQALAALESSLAGLSVEEAAQVLEVSPETIKRDWRLAKSWLKRQLCEGDSP